MRIGFVAEPYEEKNASGMGYVVLELMRQLVANPDVHEFTIYSSIPISKERVLGTYTNVIVPTSLLGKLWWFYFYKGADELLMYQVPLLPLIVPRRLKTIAMCQELGSQKIKPEGLRDTLLAFFRDRVLMPLCLARASAIATASQATKDDVVKFYGVAPERIAVINDGFQDLSTTSFQLQEQSEIRPFFFFAGKVKYRKNVHGIVSGFIAFKERTHAPCKLIIAGGADGPYYHSITKEVEHHGLQSDVLFVGYATGSTLLSYYKNAVAFVFPSYNEGFGMPPLEAMSLGTPVITSTISSMPEVAGGAALLVNPYDIEDISQGMERLYTDHALREELVAKGKERAKQFSWEKAAAEYRALLGTLAAPGPLI